MSAPSKSVVAAVVGSAALVMTLSGPGAGAQLLVSTGQATPRPHVMVVVLENHTYHQIIGDSRAPFINRLARRYALATRYHAATHPSLPNYLALTGGRTFGITTDCTSCSVGATNVGDQLETSGFRWKAYAESMPTRCHQAPWSGLYAKKHVPFLYYRSISLKLERCRTHVVPLRQLWRNIRHHAVPHFSFVVPNMCNDMHDCSVATGDAWLRNFLKRVLSAPAYAKRGVVVVTFDEDWGTTSNHVATIVVNPRARARRRLTRPYNHYSLLRSVEDVFGLGHLGRAGRAGVHPLPLGTLP